MEVTISSMPTGEKIGQRIKLETHKDALLCIPRDPYGYWHYAWEKGGEVPHILSGAYTSWNEAEKDLRRWVADWALKQEADDAKRQRLQEQEDAINEKSRVAKEEWDKKVLEEARKEAVAEDEKLSAMVAEAKKEKPKKKETK